jgi:glycosyltransferase involved in cell wall biosynthesis
VKVTILIPCFNEEDTIGEVVTRVKNLKTDFEKEILIVNDGSTDASEQKIRELGNDDICLINHPHNSGKGTAVKTGFENATGQIIVIQDADLEYFPENIPLLVKPILEGKADIVYGSRFLGTIKGMSFRHRIGNMILSIAASLLYNERITDVMTGHKAFDIRDAKDIQLDCRKFETELELTVRFLKRKKKILEIPIPYEYRRRGKSKISWKDGFTALLWLLKSKFPV